MSKHALVGKYGPRQKSGKKRRKLVPAPPTPQDFALSMMRDETQAPALRASMAKLAATLSAAQPPEPEVEEEQWSDLELARRIAHILGLAEIDGTEQLSAAQEQARAAEARAREMEQRALAAEAMLAGREPEGKMPLRSALQHATQALSDQVFSDDEHGRRGDDPFDPHPGYRWIP